MNRIEMNDEALKAHIDSLEKDEMAVFVMADGRIRGALFHGTRFVNQMRLQHGLGILETMILGEASICGALMIPMMKGQERLTLKYEGNGPAKGWQVEADSRGTVRGFLYNENIKLEKPLENWNLGQFLGNGFLSVSVLHKEDREPFSSTVEVDGGNIAENIAHYYRQSEQISTAFNSSILFDRNGKVTGAGGMFLQVMPATGGKLVSGANRKSGSDKQADDGLLRRAENAFSTSPSLGTWFSEKGNFEDLVYGLFREFKPTIALKREIRYDCPCGEETFKAHIRNLPKSELDDIRKNGPDPLEISCRNCGSVYRIPVSDL